MKNNHHIAAENTFWKNEKEKYLHFKNKHPNKDYNQYYPEKMYPAYLTALTISDLLSNFKVPTVLEAGCGLGVSLFYLGNNGVECLGVDCSIEAIKFASLLKQDFMKLHNLSCVNFKHVDFLEMNITKKYDLVFNSGVLEHMVPKKQQEFFKKMKDFTNKHIIIMIPNTSSLVFKAFIKQMSKQNRKYSPKHYQINIETLFKENGISLVKKSGRSL